MSEPYWVPLSGGPIYLPNPAARVYRTTSQSVPPGTVVPISFDAERFDTDGIHDAVNPTRLTCRTAGKYLIFGGFAWNAAVTSAQTLFRLNGTTFIVADYIIGASDHRNVQLSTVYDLAVGDYVELIAVQQSGATNDVQSAGNFSPEFGMARLDAALPTTLPPVAGGELAYADNQGTTTVTQTGEATAAVIATTPAITLDGATPVLIECYAPLVQIAAGSSFYPVLFEDGGGIGQALYGTPGTGTANFGGVHVRRRRIPAAGSHTYSFRAFASTTATVFGSDGTPNQRVPAFVRVTRA